MLVGTATESVGGWPAAAVSGLHGDHADLVVAEADQVAILELVGAQLAVAQRRHRSRTRRSC